MLSDKNETLNNDSGELMPTTQNLKEDTYQKNQTRGSSLNLPFSVKKGKQRRFDRHSGTGRGKEISKQGAGGKTVWGNDVLLARKEGINLMSSEEDIINAKEIENVIISEKNAITYKEYKEKKKKKLESLSIESKIGPKAFNNASIEDIERSFNMVKAKVKEDSSNIVKENKKREYFVFKEDHFPSLS